MNRKQENSTRLMLRCWIMVCCIGIVILSTSCSSGSVASKYYLLHSVSDPLTLTTERRTRFSVEVGPVEVAEYLDRPEIVTRINDNQLDLADFHRWGSPLRYHVPDIVTENLAHLLDSESVSAFPWERPSPATYQIKIKIGQFDGQRGSDVILKARWTVLDKDADTVLASYGASFTEAIADDTYASFVQAQSRALGRLCQRIAEDIVQLPSREFIGNPERTDTGRAKIP